MIIRKATVNDSATLISITEKLIADAISNCHPTVITASRENAMFFFTHMIYPALLAGNEPILIAEEGGRVIGASMTPIRRGAITLIGRAVFGSGWWVEPEYRNQGVLTKLLDEAEKILKPLGVQFWEESVFVGNTISQHIMEKRGFKPAMIIYQKVLKPCTP